MKKALGILIILIFVANFDISAQCAMCKAVAGSSVEGDANDVGKGLNTGILYLMAIPYALLMGMFYIFFKDKIREKIKSLKF